MAVAQHHIRRPHVGLNDSPDQRTVASVDPRPEINRPVPEVLRRQVLGLARKANWNGFGARAVPRRACEAALNFLERVLSEGLPEPDSLAPSVIGAVSMEWDAPAARLAVDAAGDSGSLFEVSWAWPLGPAGSEQADADRVIERLQQFVTLR